MDQAASRRVDERQGKLSGKLSASLFAYVRQQAWLHTVPDPPKKEAEKTKKAKKAQEKEENLTRQQKLEREYEDAEWVYEITAEPILPIEINLWQMSLNGVEDDETHLPYQLAHIWTYLLEVGPVNSNGMGPVPISYDEIQSWLDISGVELSRWEVAVLRKCSFAWMSAQYEAKKPDAVAPWDVYTPQSMADRRALVAKRFKMLGRRGLKEDDG